jgi:hypothetical protein
MFIANHLAGFGAADNATGLTISTNTSEVNILTLATALGYDNAVGGTIEVTVNSGVTVSGSTTHAMQTGALHQNTILIINNNGNINGYTGAAGSAGGLGVAGGVGSVGGDAIYIETDTGGTGILTVNNASGAYIQSGGGGGGGGGGAGRANECVYDKGNYACGGTTFTGSAGAAGSGGGFGAAGSTADSGSYGGGHVSGSPCGGGCVITAAGAGGAGGAAGYAMRKNSRTVTLNDSGTTTGTVG